MAMPGPPIPTATVGGDGDRGRRRVAAAADLVKNEADRDSGCGGARLEFDDDGSTGQQLVRAGEDDLFWLGTAEAIELGVSRPSCCGARCGSSPTSRSIRRLSRPRSPRR